MVNVIKVVCHSLLSLTIKQIRLSNVDDTVLQFNTVTRGRQKLACIVLDSILVILNTSFATIVFSSWV